MGGFHETYLQPPRFSRREGGLLQDRHGPVLQRKSTPRHREAYFVAVPMDQIRGRKAGQFFVEGKPDIVWGIKNIP